MRGAVAIFAVLLLPGCGNWSYYLQSAGGQFDIWQREAPIEKLLADSDVKPQLKTQLRRVLHIRDYASRELGLPDNRSYRTYADLARPFVVWNVFAAPEFSIKAKQWCFPVTGCVGYRGYFSEAEAHSYAQSLIAEGYDVYIGGVPAYSTIGWFADPVLNTFIHYPPPELARLIFHELAHQIVYAKGDTVFNESFATTVEQAGMARWLKSNGSEAERRQFMQRQNIRADFRALVIQTRMELAKLYAGNLSTEQKRRQKAAALAKLKTAYATQRQAWSGFAGYDRWFAQQLGNAHLASVAIYTERVPAFTALLRRNGNDLPRFYAAVRELAALPVEERNRQLDALTPLL